MLLSTLSQLNLEGANIKELLRYNGELVVVKKPLQDNCYDNISEVLAYKIAVLLGVPCKSWTARRRKSLLSYRRTSQR